MKKQITVTVNGKSVISVADVLLSEILNEDAPCGGHGKCGKCKVIAQGNISMPSQTECNLLTKDELSRGIRLACQTKALGDCEVFSLLNKTTSQIITDISLPMFDLEPMFSNYGIAIDIGTTTLAARLYSHCGDLLAETSCLNPQATMGADVISRIEAFVSGKDTQLFNAIIGAINNVVIELAIGANIKQESIDGVCITGNTVMLYLLTKESVESFSHAPFEAKRLFGETLTAKELSLSSLRPTTPIYLPPCISAFVGADIICAILATELYKNNNAMLADIGTNGEIALWHNNKLTVCSTAAGPAFEGVGISMGMRGAIGAIDRISLSNGAITANVIGDTEPVGICGSGLVDAVACMLDSNALDESGYLEADPFTIKNNVSLSAKDIRMLQLAKSAICAGLLTLIETKKLSPEDISSLYIAGGFGNYLNKESAAKIGLLPRKLIKSSHTVGNAALGGAVLLLLNSNLKELADSIAKKADVLDLSTNSLFSDHYINGMFLGEI